MSEFNNSPLRRLCDLEYKVNELLKKDIPLESQDSKSLVKSIQVWSADEQLFLTCLKRFSNVMDPYIQKGELQLDSQNQVELTVSEQSSLYKFAILQNGCALLWTDPLDQQLVEGRRQLLSLLYDINYNEETIFDLKYISKLSYFLPIENGKRWVLCQKGILENLSHSNTYNKYPKKYDYAIQAKNLETRFNEQERELLSLKSELGQIKMEVKEILHILLNSREAQSD